MTIEFRRSVEAVRSILVPIAESDENGAVQAAINCAESSGTSPSDFPTLIELEMSQWVETKRPSDLLVEIVERAVSARGEPIDAALASAYFEMHYTLMSDNFRFSFHEALAFLSHSRLVVTIATNTKMSASQISKVLSSRDARVPFSWQAVDMLLSKLKLGRAITEDMILDLYEVDREYSQVTFADATLEECEQMVGRVALRLGVSDAFSGHLRTLASPDEPSLHVPYLQILHYQCCLSEYYDLAVKYMYEFKPRGKAVEVLMEQYPSYLVSAKNPFLNNAKAVDELTPGWVRSKKTKERPGAAALYGVLNDLQSLGFPARRELSAWVRMWIHRMISMSSENTAEFFTEITLEQSIKLVEHVVSSNTQTSGVVEQRLVDAATVALYPDRKIWKPRGLEDSVNTTNTSQRKLGDCDFQNSSERVVCAFEAHGGKLTAVYLRDHVRSLKNNLPIRMAEWESFSEVAGWAVSVLFIAHEIDDEVSDIEFEFEGVSVTIKSVLYTDFLKDLKYEILLPQINRYVISVLSRRAVPESIRESVRSVIAQTVADN